jgi:2-hydroxy-3-keto-5-methylthiopentenyl-1-phosphate phosphatase
VTLPPDHPRATLPPRLRPGDPPLAILVDYDGTVALTDVSDAVLAPYVTPRWRALAAEHAAGRLGTRRLMTYEISLLTADPARLSARAAAQPHDPAFRPFVEHARELEVPIEVVSDGYGWFIEAALRALGVGDLPVTTAVTTFGASGPRIEFPNGNDACFVCGTCKRNRVLAHQAAGRAVAFVGDGASDRYAAAHADVVFAKDGLVPICRELGRPFEAWSTFADVDAWLTGTLAAFRADSATLPGPQARPLVCGPEVWGPGRWDPVQPEHG